MGSATPQASVTSRAETAVGRGSAGSRRVAAVFRTAGLPPGCGRRPVLGLRGNRGVIPGPFLKDFLRAPHQGMAHGHRFRLLLLASGGNSRAFRRVSRVFSRHRRPPRVNGVVLGIRLRFQRSHEAEAARVDPTLDLRARRSLLWVHRARPSRRTSARSPPPRFTPYGSRPRSRREASLIALQARPSGPPPLPGRRSRGPAPRSMTRAPNARGRP